MAAWGPASRVLAVLGGSVVLSSVPHSSAERDKLAHPFQRPWPSELLSSHEGFENSTALCRREGLSLVSFFF